MLKHDHFTHKKGLEEDDTLTQSLSVTVANNLTMIWFTNFWVDIYRYKGQLGIHLNST